MGLVGMRVYRLDPQAIDSDASKKEKSPFGIVVSVALNNDDEWALLVLRYDGALERCWDCRVAFDPIARPSVEAPEIEA